MIKLLTTLFIALKLIGTITWSWFWILSPIWIGLPIYLILNYIIEDDNQEDNSFDLKNTSIEIKTKDGINIIYGSNTLSKIRFVDKGDNHLNILTIHNSQS